MKSINSKDERRIQNWVCCSRRGGRSCDTVLENLLIFCEHHSSNYLRMNLSGTPGISMKLHQQKHKTWTRLKNPTIYLRAWVLCSIIRLANLNQLHAGLNNSKDRLNKSKDMMHKASKGWRLKPVHQLLHNSLSRRSYFKWLSLVSVSCTILHSMLNLIQIWAPGAIEYYLTQPPLNMTKPV